MLSVSCSTTPWASIVKFVKTGFSGRQVYHTTELMRVIPASVMSLAPPACASKMTPMNTLEL